MRRSLPSATALVTVLALLALGLVVLPHAVTPARADDSEVTIQEAAVQAAESGHPVLATAATTESSTITANPDGTLTGKLGAGPMQEPDSESPTGWSAINLTLEHADGTYAPAVSAADTKFSDGGAGALAIISEGTTIYTENWDGSLPTPSVSGDTAIYANVLPEIDLVMQAQTTGFKQSFVVHTAPSDPLVLDVPLSLRGLSATVDEDGNLIITDAQGNTVAAAGTAVMYGATTDDSGEPTVLATVDTEVVTGQHGDPVFRISPDQSFFSRPGLTYPVTIDPSPNLSATNDTYVRQSTPTTSYITDDVLKVGSNNGSDVMRGLLQFDLATIEGDGVDVSSATLSLYETEANTCTATEVDIYDATSVWAGIGLPTWNNQPGTGTLYASASDAHGFTGCSNDWVNISTGGASGHTLADLVMGWEDGSVSNYGVVVKAASESNSTYWKKFRSSEAGSNFPTLSITYATCSAEILTQTTSTISGSPDLSLFDGTEYGYAQSDESQPTGCTNVTPGEIDVWRGIHTRTFHGWHDANHTQWDQCVKKEFINQPQSGPHVNELHATERVDCTYTETVNWEDPFAGGGWVLLWRILADGSKVMLESNYSNAHCQSHTTCQNSPSWYTGTRSGRTFQSEGHSSICFLGESPNCRGYTTIFSNQVSL
jgi:hypothetical protein